MATTSDAVEEQPVTAGRRGRGLGLTLVVVVAASALSFALGSRIKSPAEVASRTAPPVASLISVPAELRTLSADVVTRGTVKYGTPQTVSLPASAVKKGPGLVTTAPVKGAVLDEGGVAFTVSGRPVFVLQGPRPNYRDLGPGISGDDVKQLEDALIRLGFKPGPADGVYDARTASAVRDWYKARGFEAAGPGQEQVQAAKGAELELIAAQEALATAKVDLAAAQERGNAARAAAKEAAAAEATAKANNEAELKAAGEDVAARENALDAALLAQQGAQQRMDDAQASSRRPSQTQLSALAADVEKTTKAVQDARTALTAAETVEAAIKPYERGTAVADANREAAAADADAARAAAAIPLAERRVAVLSGNAGSGGAGLGTVVPADEVLFFPALPVRVDEVKLGLGAEVAGPPMTVTSSGLIVEAGLSATDAKLVTNGAPVAIKAPDLGVEANGSVSDIASSPGTNGVDPQRFYLAVAPGDVPASLVGASVVLTIKVESTNGDVIAVPVAALSQAADGSARVQVQAPDKSTRFVTVTPGLAAKGMVAVTPVNGTLEPGTLVVVGRGPNAKN